MYVCGMPNNDKLWDYDKTCGMTNNDKLWMNDRTWMYVECLIMMDYDMHANHMNMWTGGQIKSWPDYLKTKGNLNIKLWDFDCLHFAQYISISQNVIDYKQTWCKKIYRMNRGKLIEFLVWVNDKSCMLNAQQW